jgi:4-amino-4-deoxy-L-arabinose transferase-like glycosyltransferase
MSDALSTRRRVLLILAISFVTRLLFGVLVVGLDAPPVDDAATYDQIATNLLSEGAYVQYHESGVWYSVRTPVLPFLLAGVYRLIGHSFVASRLLMMVIGSMIPLAVFALAHRMYGREVALVAGIISACYPFFIVYSSFLLTETPFVLLVCLLLVFLFRFVDGRRIRDICAAGAMGGLACLTRATLLAFIPVCVIWLLVVMRHSLLGALKAVVLFALVAAAVISPWTYRNYLVHGTLMPVSSRGGVVLWMGNNQWATGNIVQDYHMLLEIMPDPATTGEAEIGSICQQKAIDYMRENPGRTLLLGLKKVYHFWRPASLLIPGLPTIAPRAGLRALGLLSYMPVLILFLVGCLMLLKDGDLLREPRVVLLILLMLTYTLIHFLFPPVPRYRQPIMPAMIIIGSWSLVRMVAGFGTMRPAARR